MIELPLPEDLPSDPVATYVPSTRAFPMPPLGSDALGAAPDAPSRGPATFDLSRWSLTSLPPVDAAETTGAPPPERRAATETAAPAYQLVRQVARGGMGEVWEAWQESLGRVVAVKRARFDYIEKLRQADAETEVALALAEFRMEAATAARLEHPNIVPVHDLGADPEGNPLLAMKMVKGEPWHKLLAEDFQTLSPTEFLARHVPILADVAQAVAFAHARGIVHRDLKPAQVMVGEFGETLLMDWGLAIEMDPADAAKERPRLRPPNPSTASNPAGTPALMAPEQTDANAANIGPWTDVYLLGATLYFLLTGAYPHTARTSAESMRRAREGVVVPPSEKAPHRQPPPELESLCLAAMEKEPRDRVGSARAFVAALNDYLTGATRRRESVELAARAARELDSDAPLGYAELSSCQETLSRAQSLWPENESLPDLFDRAHMLHAERALASGDLTLARLQAERVRAGEAKKDVLRRADERARKLASLAKQRRLLLVGLASLSLVVIGGLGCFSRAQAVANRDLAIANQQLKEERELSDELRRDAERRARSSADLVELLMQGARRGLDPNKPEEREMIEEIAAGVMKHFRGARPGRYHDDALARTIQSMIDVSGAMRNWDRLDEAEELATMSLALLDRVAPNEEGYRYRPINALALVRMERGDFETALELLRQSLDIRLRLLRPDDLNIAIARVSLGSLLVQMRRPDLAAPYLDEAIKAYEAAGSEGDELIPAALQSKAMMLRQMNQPVEAESLLRRAIEIEERVFGHDHEYTAREYDCLASVLHDQEREEESIAASREAIAIYSRIFGPAHVRVAGCEANAARMALERGDHERAYELALSAIPTLERVVGDLDETVFVYDTMSSALDQMDRLEEAIVWADKFRDAMLRLHGVGSEQAGMGHFGSARARKRLGMMEEARAEAKLALESFIEGKGADSQEVLFVRFLIATRLEMPDIAGVDPDVEQPPIPLPPMPASNEADEEPGALEATGDASADAP